MRSYKANRLVPFSVAYLSMKQDILNQPFMTAGSWQSQSTDMKTRELMGAVLEYFVPDNQIDLIADLGDCGLGLPWAEDHFQERVGGLPLNPPPSEAWWPHNQNKNAAHKFSKDGKAEQFSHTYPERFWPKRAGDDSEVVRKYAEPNRGIRFALGDLGDVVELLRRAPGTRQAYLPVWFPEDTGTVHGQRVPCTLGYHFMIRNDRLQCWYYMRSCDLIRHFPDDVYMAARLMQWMCDQLQDVIDVEPGVLTMSMSSLHTFEADDHGMRRDVQLAGGRR